MKSSTPDDEARFLRLAAQAPTPLAEKVRAGSALAGERRVVTVLFVDVVGSTSLAERLDVEVWSEIMNGAFEAVTPAIFRYEGTIARLMGDALVAFFGAPVAHEDDPFRATSAALEALEAARAYARRVQEDYGIEFAMRACLNRGPVVLGTVGNNLKYDYTPLGGVVNLAARIKFASQPMTALITENLYRLIAPLFDLKDLGLLEVKDQNASVRVFQILGHKAEPGSLRGLAGLESPMVGRDRELAALVKHYEPMRAGLGRAALIVGEPGLGKTRLIAEWESAIAMQMRIPPPLWATGRCLSYGQSMAYHLVIDLIHSLLGISGTADEAETRAAFESLVRENFGDLEDGPAQEIYPYLGRLLSINLQGAALERLKALDPEGLQSRYQNALEKLVAALASVRPVVLILEDLHWADPSSVELLTGLLPLAFNQPVLFCLVARPERDSFGWKLVTSTRDVLGGVLTELVLEPLPEQDSRRLISNLLKIEALPEQVRKLILKKSEGNPFFVEEVIRMLIERGAVVQSGRGWSAAAEIDEVEIPDNLQSLLLARIDRLSDDGKRTLRIASVVGRQFPVRVLEEVMKNGGGGGRPVRALSTLESAGLVRVAQVEPDLEYLFRHTMVQEAAYSSLLVSDRRRLHLAVGFAIENLYADRLAENASTLAMHFEEGGEGEQALRYFILAGEAALASYANHEAEGYYRRALELTCCTAEQRSGLFANLGEALVRQSRFDEAIQIWRSGIQTYREAGDRDGEARLYAWSARAAWHNGDTPEGLRICLQGMDETAGSPESPDLARLLHETARACYFNGQPDKAKTLCMHALEMAERLGAVDVQADTLTTLGVLPSLTPGEAVAALERAVDLAESNNLLQIAGRAHQNLGTVIRAFSWDNHGAREQYNRAAEIAELRGVLQDQFLHRSSSMSVLLEMGDFASLEAELPALERIVQALPNPEMARLEVTTIKAMTNAITKGTWFEGLSDLKRNLADARRRGDLQNSLNMISSIAYLLLEMDFLGEPVDFFEVEALLQEVLEAPDQGFGKEIWSRSEMIRLYARQARFKDARRLLGELCKLFEDPQSIHEKQALLIAEAELAASESKWDEAISALETFVSNLTIIDHGFVRSRSLLSWAEAFLARGQPDDLIRAQDMLQESHDQLVRMGAAPFVAYAEQRIRDLRSETEARVIENRNIALELAQAGKIQASFLPDEIPQIPGWSLAAVLEPARQTSGDYYDFIPLPDGRLGILVADVADKGAAAALFMASSRTLIRTYAREYPTQPEQVIQAANRQLLGDTHSGLFVTLFYGVLDPATGNVVYCNAGHNPPYVFKSTSPEKVLALHRTGTALGIIEETTFGSGAIQLGQGDILLMYTDGITEALGTGESFYGENRLQEAVVSSLRVPVGEGRESHSAQRILDFIRGDLYNFTQDLPRSDDLTLICLVRNPVLNIFPDDREVDA